MAVDRWFGGVPAARYSHKGLTFMAEPDYSTYIVALHLHAGADGVTGLTIGATIFGTRKGQSAREALFRIDDVNLVGLDLENLAIELEPGTICYALATAADNNTPIQIVIEYIKAPAKNTGAKDFPRGYPEGSVKDIRSGYRKPADTNDYVVETLIATHAITQPGLQATPAVADELQIVAGAGDTVSATIEYWDSDGTHHVADAVTLTEDTPVDLIEDIADFYVWDKIRLSGKNTNAVLLQDAAGE